MKGRFVFVFCGGYDIRSDREVNRSAMKLIATSNLPDNY